MMPLKLATVSVLALTLAGCGTATRTSAAATGKLDCPSQAGELTRLSAAPDGKTCVYRIADGAEVTLRLLPVSNGDPTATLALIEKSLMTEAKGPEGAAPPAQAKALGAAAEAARVQAEAASDAAGEAQDAAERARDKADAWDDKAIEAKVNAKLKEKGIDVDADGETTHVDMPGIHITADDANDRARVDVGPLHIDAGDDTATIRSMKDVRLRGEAFSADRRGIRAMFIYAGDHLGDGYKYVGYEASGPKTGPIAVAVVKSRKDGGFHGDIYGDVKRLVRRNGGT